MPTTVSIDWQGPKVRQQVTNHLLRGARAAGRALRDDARAKAPRRTGKLKKQIRHSVRRSRRRQIITIRVGFTPEGFYGRFLQQGTRFIAPRTIIDLEANEAQIVRSILRGGR